MEGLKSEIRILLVLAKASKPLRFSEILDKTGLSSATVSKWLDIFVASGLVEKTEEGYSLTSGGLGYLIGVMDRIVSEALDAGAVSKVVHYVDSEVSITRNVSGEYEIHFNAHGEKEYKVIINIGDTPDVLEKIVELYEKLVKGD